MDENKEDNDNNDNKDDNNNNKMEKHGEDKEDNDEEDKDEDVDKMSNKRKWQYKKVDTKQGEKDYQKWMSQLKAIQNNCGKETIASTDKKFVAWLYHTEKNWWKKELMSWPMLHSKKL